MPETIPKNEDKVNVYVHCQRKSSKPKKSINVCAAACPYCHDCNEYLAGRQAALETQRSNQC